MDHKTLGYIFQEIVVEFSEIGPTNLDELEDRMLKVYGPSPRHSSS